MVSTNFISDSIDIIGRGTNCILNPIELHEKLKRSAFCKQPLTVKLGVDPTAPDLHLGHTVPLRKLRHFQQLGHEAVFLVGDFTGAIGDPSGRNKTRQQLTHEQIIVNAESYLEQVSKVLDITKLKVVYNSTWLSRLTLEELAKMTAHTTLSRLLEHNTYKHRMNRSESIRMHELLYPFMQGYDSVVLKADVEIGGSDQTFNLTFGRDLQKLYAQEPQVCITMPILVGTDGVKKMSKSLGNYIGIAEPAPIMFEKIMRMADSNILDYFTLLTDLPAAEIRALRQKLNFNPATELIIDCKKRLAADIIAQFHGAEAAAIAFNEYGSLQKTDLPEVVLKESSVSLVDFMVIHTGIKSRSEARRLIAQKGVSINGITTSLGAEEVQLTDGDIFRCGKQKLFRIKVN